MVYIAHNAKVHEKWPTTPKYDVAEISTYLTSRHADAILDFANNSKLTTKNED